MSGQDELKRLDEELAAGRVSAEDYRQRRDDLVAQDLARRGVGGGGGASSPPPAPFPPAFRWETAAPSDNTQLISHDESEQTQVVPYDSESTQVVAGSGHPPGRWGAGDSAPPWASSDLPPMPEPNAGWIAREPDFGSQRRSRTGRVVGAITAVVLLLAAAAVGAYFLIGANRTTQAGQPPAATGPSPAVAEEEPPVAGEEQKSPVGEEVPPPAPAPAAPESPAPEFDLPNPAPIGGDGTPRTLAAADLGAAGILTPEEFATLEQGGVDGSTLLDTTFADGPRATILITRLPEAAAVRDELAALQESFGFEPAPGPAGLSNFLLREDPAGMTVVRGFYVSGDLLVRIEVIGTELVPTARRYDTLVDQQRAALPADA